MSYPLIGFPSFDSISIDQTKLNWPPHELTPSPLTPYQLTPGPINLHLINWLPINWLPINLLPINWLPRNWLQVNLLPTNWLLVNLLPTNWLPIINWFPINLLPINQSSTVFPCLSNMYFPRESPKNRMIQFKKKIVFGTNCNFLIPIFC